MTEKELAGRCREGDETAFKELYDSLSPMLMAVCKRYLGFSPYVKDVFQDGFVAIIDSFSKFAYRGEGSLSAWARRVMVNTSLKWLRDHQTNEIEIPIEVPDEPEPSEAEAASVPEEVIRRFIMELPDGYRTVLNLYVFEELSHKEIGRILGIGEKSSSSQYYRAKQLLAKRITAYANGIKR